MNSLITNFQKTYSGLDTLLSVVEQTPFFVEKGISKKFSSEFLSSIKIRNVEFEEKFQNALYLFRKEYEIKIISINDLINIDYRMFLTLPYVGGMAIRKAKHHIRSSILEYFVDIYVLKGQTKTLYVRRNLYGIKKKRGEQGKDNNLFKSTAL
jgi:hypothetical protein